MVKKILAVIGLSFAAFTAIAQTGAPPASVPPVKFHEPWWGTWVNGEKDRKFIMEPWEDGIKMVSLVANPNGGAPLRITAFARFDGKIYPESGNSFADGIIFTPIDARSFKYQGTKDGKEVMSAIISFPEDGVTRISTRTGQPPTTWWREQPKYDKPWYGHWATETQSLIMEPWEDGFTIITNTKPTKAGEKYQHETVFGRFDGKDYVESGNPGTDALSLFAVDERTYGLALKKDGKEHSRIHVTISADGKTRTSMSTKKGPDGKPEWTKEWKRVR